MNRVLRDAAVPALIVGALAIAACGGDDRDSGGDGAGASSGQGTGGGASHDGGDDEGVAQRKPAGTTIKTAGSEFGPMLFDAADQAIYLFDRETDDRPECYGACAAAWPPVLTRGEPRASGATRQRLLGTAERHDGSIQVTYGGRPLYYYAHEGPGQVLCHDVEEFGGLWLVVQPDGEPAPA